MKFAAPRSFVLALCAAAFAAAPALAQQSDKMTTPTQGMSAPAMSNGMSDSKSMPDKAMNDAKPMTDKAMNDGKAMNDKAMNDAKPMTDKKM